MTFVPVPKYLQWHENRLPQTYQCSYNHLIVSGCSFTSSTLWFEGPASWPGYVRDRCAIDLVTDMSFPGVGNRYIADSIRHAIDTLHTNVDPRQILVVVMWSGIDRAEKILHDATTNPNWPRLGSQVYQRLDQKDITQQILQETTYQSFDLIMGLKRYLEQRNIAWAFTSYANLAFDPYIPKRDTTHHWHEYLDPASLRKIREFPWHPDSCLDYLYEWSFLHDHLNTGDGFHPPNEAVFSWTDQILLPSLCGRRLISKK